MTTTIGPRENADCFPSPLREFVSSRGVQGGERLTGAADGELARNEHRLFCLEAQLPRSSSMLVEPH